MRGPYTLTPGCKPFTKEEEEISISSPFNYIQRFIRFGFLFKALLNIQAKTTLEL